MSSSQPSDLRTHWSFDLTLSQGQYRQRLLERYRATPTVAGVVRQADRQLAHNLYERGVPLSLVEAAFSLAAARRILRDPQALPLTSIRSLHYFLPVLDELLRDPPDPRYIECINIKLRLESQKD